jgi:tRNA threonylcarbamoyladenosine biosynthesis protein TsaB
VNVADRDGPRVLLLETSARVGLVAVAAGDRVLGTRRLEETRRHARDLAPAVGALLAEQGWAPRDLAAVMVSKGPGSYTGLRVGVMSAKAFAYATGCSLIGIETFAALAVQAPAAALVLDVVADAQQDRVYVQRFGRAEGEYLPTARGPLSIRPFADWLGDLDKAPWITGPGLRGKEARVPAAIQVTAPEVWEIQPVSLLQLGLARYDAGQRDDLWTLEPLYLRPSAAEQQWAARVPPANS